MALDIDRLLSPVVLPSLHEDIPPVQCKVWMGKDQYESIQINVYPFDTLDMIKFAICERYRKDPSFHPRYLFVGIPEGDAEPTLETQYVPLDYLWYSNQTQSVRETHRLAHPRTGMTHGDEWFINANGSYSSPIMELRGRSTIEDVFLTKGSIPTLHVYSLAALLKEYRGITPIADVDWNKRFAGYFPDVPLDGPYQPTKEDALFSKTIHAVVTKRTAILGSLNQMIEDGIMNPNMQVTGIHNMTLMWKKPIQGFEGAASLFYRLPVTEKRPYLRLLPSDGSPITKLHVRGVVPIPTLEDPRVLEGWGEDVSPDPTTDVCIMKYVHCSASGIVQPIYGTFCILNDGTMTLTIQPPKSIKRLTTAFDFNEFRAYSERIMNGLPQPADDYVLHDMSIHTTLTLDLHSKRFTKARLLDRLAQFQPLFTTIESLPNDNAILSLRYTAVSQYASEDNVFQFLTQFAMQQQQKGEVAHATQLVEALQEQFQFSTQYASEVCKKWLAKRERFTLQQPEDGEFEETFHPGIDIHIYEKHPEYVITVHRINRYSHYIRLYTLLSLLFVEDDHYFKLTTLDAGLLAAEKAVEASTMRRERQDESEESMTASDASQKDGMHSPVSLEELDDFPIEPQEEKEEPKAIAAPVDRKVIDPSSWFINRLKELDKKLFDYRPADGDKNGYTRKCTRNTGSQPVSLTKEQYERMRKIYEKEPIFWLEYPLLGTDTPVEPKGMMDTITVMRFGSHPNTIHYYFCPEYFCLLDELMILPRDFEGTVDSKGGRKPPNTCPFCHGLLIHDRKQSSSRHTVVKKNPLRGGEKTNRHIDFLKKSSHPKKYELPCCFSKPISSSDPLRLSDKAFDHIRSELQEEEPPAAEEEMKYYGDMIYPNDVIIPYGSYLATIQRRNLLEAGKLLSPGSFGILPPTFDTFFEQTSFDTIVKRITGNLKLRPNANGFLRMGTENPPNESLLGVIAPLLYLNSIREVKERIIAVMVPLVFIHSHFGNLVMEFYDPRDGDSMPATQNELKLWAKSQLGVLITANNQYEVIRVYNSWHRFIRFIQDPLQRKELRHLQPLLAEPGLFRTEGLQLLIMNDEEPVTIQCPRFGVSMERQRLNEIAFVSRTITGNNNARYELYIYTSNQSGKGRLGEVHEHVIRWNYESRRYWPAIVKTRIDEYMQQCQSRYRTVYTPQPALNPMALLPMSKAVDASPESIEGVVKDAYNHVMGITFRVKPGKNSPLVMLPVIDDGFISISHSVDNLYLDIEDVPLASLEDTIAFYQSKLVSLFSLYPGYHIKYVARRKKGDQFGPVNTLQLENGIYLPTGPSQQPAIWDDPENGQLKAFYQQWNIQGMVSYTHLQWEIDRDMLGKKWESNEAKWEDSLGQLLPEKSCGEDPLSSSTYAEWESSYQQFRLMVSNWLASDRAGPLVRDTIERIIFHRDLPEYERRKRLFIYLSPVLLTWFYPDDNDKWDKGITTILRKDCQLIDKPDDCTGTCHWKQDEGRCLLHVSATTELGEKRRVSTPDLYTKRVIDELVRFPARRKQLMKPGGVSHVSPLLTPIHQGDQYMIPESTPTWANLLRMDWATDVAEKPKYYEEQTSEEKENDQPLEQGDMPDALQAIVGADTPFRMMVPEIRSAKRMPLLLPFTSILGLTLDRIGLPSDATRFTREALIQYVKETSLPIGMIDVTAKEPIQFVKPSGGTFTSVTVLVFLPGRAGLLIEKEGVSTVSIANFPPNMLAQWEAAGRVLIKKKIAQVETIEELPLLVQRVEVAKRKPRMGQLPS